MFSEYLFLLRKGLVWAIASCVVFLLLTFAFDRTKIDVTYFIISIVAFVIIGAPLYASITRRIRSNR